MNTRDIATYRYVPETDSLLLLSEGGLLISIDVTKRKSISWQIGVPIIPSIHMLDPYSTRMIHNYHDGVLTVILQLFQTHEIQRVTNTGKEGKSKGKLTIIKKFNEEFLAVRVVDNLPSIPFRLPTLGPVLQRIDESVKFLKFDHLKKGRIGFFGNNIVFMYGLVPFYLSAGDQKDLQNASSNAVEHFLTRFGYSIKTVQKFSELKVSDIVESFTPIDVIDGQKFATEKIGSGKTRKNFDRVLGVVYYFEFLSILISLKMAQQ